MSTTPGDGGRPKKRKGSRHPSDEANAPKKARSEEPPTTKPSLIGPHEATIAELQPKYDVLVASVISSTQIHKRITQALAHLGASSEKPPVVLLHARPAEVCKLATIVEQCKRLLTKEGKAWYQYNELFTLPPETKNTRKTTDVVEETVLDRDGAGDDSDDAAFETMTRFEKAVAPPPPPRVANSLRIFLSSQSIPELKAKSGVTVQTAGP
ncbi:alba domain-containing protein [Purpureocillium lavendulum]|uniref:Alba domain-containing protein n=1 Tax=Purpureocillium lavendulum TaxID=1247861 RepID=A0AB34FQF3_9HYPO|nr:alba domain-containing protein [Purpureocillium lavendulum]